MNRYGMLFATGISLVAVHQAFGQNATQNTEIVAAIQTQLEAFKRDDAAAAFGQAAPSIKGMFPNDVAFMEMVKRGYQPVYRQRSYEFTDLKETNLGLTQSVRIIDSMGEAWNAVYRVEKQGDGSWKISGCWLFKIPQTGT